MRELQGDEMSKKRELGWCEFYRTSNWVAAHKGRKVLIYKPDVDVASKDKVFAYDAGKGTIIPWSSLLRIIRAAQTHREW